MNPAILVLLQVLIVIGLSRLMGLLCRQIKQPLVIGEIIAGIMLGPSLLGLIAPNVMTALFPAETLPYLNILSQIGLIFFMFLIGLELNPKYLSGQLEKAVLISHVSIVVPFALGISTALILYPIVSNNGVSFTAFALFLGSALSITAFPVLARIITENNLQVTRLGTLALTCAAVDDVTAWCLLALAIAVTRTNSISGAFPTIIASILYIILMATAGRWLLRKLSIHYQRTGRLTQWVLAWIYMGVVASALITELIGIHLIFGAFLVLEKSKDNLDKIVLSGKFKEPEMILSGISNPLLFCSSYLSPDPNQLTLTGEFKEKIFMGKIQDKTLSKPINFTAKINSVSSSKKPIH
jgi:Kef-type K+ transport system membrane component KefB